MKLRLSIWSLVVVAVALSSVVLLSGDQAMASNMGFKFNRVVYAQGAGLIGKNQIALPYRNPYPNTTAVCTALGLATTATVKQLNASSGVTDSTTCGGTLFALTPRVGIIVTNPTAAGGILVGSHASNTGVPGNAGAITIYKAGADPIGKNHFPPPYHTTDVTSGDLCTDLGVPTGTSMKQLNASTGVTDSTTCGGALFNLSLGDTMVILMPTSQLTNIVVAAGHPAHF